MWIHVPKSIHPYPSVVDMGALKLPSEKLSELERFAMWKSESRSAKSWSTLWTKNSSMRRLYGLTSPTSQLTSSVTVWTSCKAASLVSHLASQDSRREQKTPEISGPQSLGSYEALGHQSSFWRTSPESSPIISTRSGPNWSRWVTWLRRVYSQRALTAAHRRDVRGSSSWPTPRGRDYKGEGHHDTLPTTSMNWPSPQTMDTLPPRSEEANRERFTTGARTGRTTPDNLREFVQPEMHPSQWPTPDSNYSGEGYGPNLREKATSWPTPRAAVDHMGLPRQHDRGDLQAAALTTNWPTPSSDGSQGEISVDLERKGAKLYNKQTGRILQAKLATEVRWWPTVTQDSAAMRKKKYAQGGNPLSLEAASHSSRLDPTTQEDGSGFSPDGPSSVPPIARKDTECSPTCRRLRAEFAEWLMGLPPGWTNASEQLGTELYRSHALSLSIRLAEEGFFDED